MPAGHAVHTVLPATAKVPAAHAVQADWAVVPPKEPAGHVVHTVFPANEYAPAEHAPQVYDCVWVDELVYPALQVYVHDPALPATTAWLSDGAAHVERIQLVNVPSFWYPELHTKVQSVAEYAALLAVYVA